MTTTRQELLDEVAARLPAAVGDACVLVAVDGPDGAGKTTFADELAARVRLGGRPVVRVSVDDFHHVRAVRHRRGPISPLGCWLDSYDHARLVGDVLGPLGPDGDRRYRAAAHDLATDEVLDPERRTAPAGAVVVVDGLFLHRPELAAHWHHSVYLDVPFAVTAARMATRDGSDPDPDHPGMRRYVGAQLIYGVRCTPRAAATVVIDNARPDAPRLVPRPAPPGAPRRAAADPEAAPALRLRRDDLERERPTADRHGDGNGDGDGDDHFPEALATFVIDTLSRPGDRVLDPFAGHGTTPVVAERLGRRALGVELLPGRAASARRRLAGPGSIITADARTLDRLDIGEFDLCLTSPPYMNAVDHPENPLTGYRTRDGSYRRYLAEMGGVFAAVARRLRPGGVFVLNAADVRTGDVVTPLADDLSTAAQASFTLVDVVPLAWDHAPPALEDDRLLVFSPVRG